mgnify:CR=1 FL=1
MAERKKTDKDGGSGVDLLDKEKAKNKVKPPKKYKVVYHNDDYTPMEFVVDVLMKYFSKDMNQANEVMMHVHRNGTGLCGIYPFDIAETKVMQVMNYSIKNGHPLQCKMEKNK